jgi:hypothetical protein
VESALSSLDVSLASMSKLAEVFEARATQLTQLDSRVERESQERAHQLAEYKTQIDNQVTVMLKNNESQNDEFSSMRQVTRNAVTKLESKARSF